MRTFIVAIVALVVGAAGGYFYEKNETGKLSAQMAAVEAQIAKEMEATKSATAEIESLKADVAAKTKEIADYVAKVTDLESNQAAPAEPAAQ